MKFKDGLLFGLVLGVAAAFLYSPKTGEEIREEVKDKLNSVPEHLFNFLESLLDLSISVLGFTKGSFQGQREKLSRAFSSGLNAAKDKTDELTKVTSK